MESRGWGSSFMTVTTLQSLQEAEGAPGSWGRGTRWGPTPGRLHVVEEHTELRSGAGAHRALGGNSKEVSIAGAGRAGQPPGTQGAPRGPVRQGMGPWPPLPSIRSGKALP